MEHKAKHKTWYRGFVFLLSILDNINHKKTFVLTMLLTHHIVNIYNTKHNYIIYKMLKTIFLKISFQALKGDLGGIQQEKIQKEKIHVGANTIIMETT